MKKLTLLCALLAMLLAVAAPALAQTGNEQVNADSTCDDGTIEAKAGGVVAKAPCTPPPPPPPAAPKATPTPPPPPAPTPAPAPAPAPKAALPETGGAKVASLFALGAGALLVGGGLIARRIIK
jgi:LPXTG-motif cell wall-anchored protein